MFKPMRIRLGFDTDRDGVLDFRDCRPFDSKRQDIKPNKKMAEELKKLPIYVSDRPGEKYHVMSKEAQKNAFRARTEFLSTLKKHPYVLSDIKKYIKKTDADYVYQINQPRDKLALGIRKTLIQDDKTRRAILGSETESFDALQPFVNRYESKLEDIGSYSFPEKFTPKSDMLPDLRGFGSNPFTLKSYDDTYIRHSGRVSKTNKVPYKLIVDKNFQKNVIDKVVYGYGFDQLVSDVTDRGKLMKSHLRSLRISVKWATHVVIGKQLTKYSYPKSWDTAFYVTNYEKINSMMERITQKIVKKYFPKRTWEDFGEYNRYESY